MKEAIRPGFNLTFTRSHNHNTQNNTMKEASKKDTTKPAVKVKDIAPKKDAKGGRHTGPEHAMKHSGPEHAMKHSGPSKAA